MSEVTLTKDEAENKLTVYCAYNNNTSVRRAAKMIDGIVWQINCLECDGAGIWDYGPGGSEEQCVACKGTGKQYVGI